MGAGGTLIPLTPPYFELFDLEQVIHLLRGFSFLICKVGMRGSAGHGPSSEAGTRRLS